MCDIIVVGGCVTDLISSAQRLPKPGETLVGHNFFKNYGGNGANQCIVAQRLGAMTTLITKLGNDTFGKEYLCNLQDNGVCTDFISMTSTSSTSTASIWVPKDGTFGQYSVVYVPGSNMELQPDDVRRAASLIADTKLLICTYEVPLDALLEALSTAKKHNVLTITNAAPPAPSTYEEVYPLTDILCVNEEEAEAATGIPVVSIDAACKALEVLLKKVCRTVVVTLGEKGVIFKSKDQDTHSYIPAKRVEAVDCLGAGDAFLGSLAYFLSKCPNLPFHVMVQKSCEIAAFTVTKHGTQSSYPYRKDLPHSLWTVAE